MKQQLLNSLALATLVTLTGCAADDGESGDLRALLVVSNHGELGDTGAATGVWMAELTHPYWALVDSGLDIDIDIASPDGGDAPIDSFSAYFNFDDFLREGIPDSGDPGNDRFFESAETRGFVASELETVTWPDGTTSEVMSHRFTGTLKLAELDYRDYDVIYFAGGNGAMWQFPANDDVHDIIRDMYESDRIVSAACHGTATLLNATLSDGSYLAAGKQVTGFSTAEEVYLQQEDVMPFLIQEVFGQRGASYVEADPWVPNVVVDGNLITGQNPPSAEGVGEAIVEALRARTGLN